MQLDLSDSQRDQVRSIMDSHDAELKDVGSRAATARKNLEDAITADAVDEGLIRTRAAELATVEADMAVLRARISSEVFKILTTEQQTKAREMRTRMEERMERQRERLQQRPRPTV
jgi:Spy/CpxP family protein refolding chaperone